MSTEEQLILSVVGRVCTGLVNRDNAQKILRVSERTLRRYVRDYKIRGPLFVKHGNYKRPPVNALSREFRAKVEELIRTKYFDFNILHAKEFLLQNEGIKISRESLRRLYHKLRLVKRKHKRRSKAHHKRPRMEAEGLMLQMDGSHHRWFGERETCLIAAIDDASSNIPYAEIFNSEDTLSCMTVLEKIISSHGIPHILYVDRAGLFGGPKRVMFSQFMRACEELGINLIYADSPEAKGRVERLFGTLQDRLVAEFRYNNVKTMPKANEYLQNIFLPKYRRKFCVQPKIKVPQYRKYSPQIELKEILCLKEFRQVKNDHTFSYNSKLYKIVWPGRQSIARQNIEIRTYQNLTTRILFAGNDIEVQIIEKDLKIHTPLPDQPDKVAG